jgi:hypothetical protein
VTYGRVIAISYFVSYDLGLLISIKEGVVWSIALLKSFLFLVQTV